MKSTTKQKPIDKIERTTTNNQLRDKLETLFIVSELVKNMDDTDFENGIIDDLLTNCKGIAGDIFQLETAIKKERAKRVKIMDDFRISEKSEKQVSQEEDEELRILEEESFELISDVILTPDVEIDSKEFKLSEEALKQVLDKVDDINFNRKYLADEAGARVVFINNKIETTKLVSATNSYKRELNDAKIEVLKLERALTEQTLTHEDKEIMLAKLERLKEDVISKQDILNEADTVPVYSAPSTKDVENSNRTAVLESSKKHLEMIRFQRDKTQNAHGLKMTSAHDYTGFSKKN